MSRIWGWSPSTFNRGPKSLWLGQGGKNVQRSRSSCGSATMRSSGHSYFLLSLRPQSNVNWYPCLWMQLQNGWWHFSICASVILCVSDRFSQLTSIASTTEHMDSGGIHCWKSFAVEQNCSSKCVFVFEVQLFWSFLPKDCIYNYIYNSVQIFSQIAPHERLMTSLLPVLHHLHVLRKFRTSVQKLDWHVDQSWPFNIIHKIIKCLNLRLHDLMLQRRQ